MARRKIRRRFGQAQTDHEVKARAGIASARDQAEKANHLIDVGNCGFALQHLLTAKGAISSAMTHYTMGARTPGLTDEAKRVQKVAERFNVKCIRR